MPDEFDWVQRLQSTDEERDAAISELREILMRGMSYSLVQRGGGQPFAEDVVQQALIKILKSVDSFEGRSRFTTWAMTIATRIGISELRRRHFKDVSLEQIAGDGDLKIELATSRDPDTEQESERTRILKQLQETIDNDLTDKQKLAVRSILGGMPVEEIARRTNANRNAVYKLFHDARKKLKLGLEKQGITNEDIQAMMG